MEKSEVIDLIKEFFEDIHVFALMTVDSGYPVARPMSGVIFHDENTILLSSHKRSKKFKHIAQQPTATLFMQESQRYLNIRGKPSMEDNQKLKDKYWRDKWAEYYKDGRNSKDYCFFKLEIEHVSYMDFIKNIKIDMDF